MGFGISTHPERCVETPSKILKFADDTKLYSAVTNQDDIEILRSDLVNLCHWSKDWLMLFDIDKCKTLHIGREN